LLHETPLLSFEWAWNLLHSVSWNDELYLAVCRSCRNRYVQEANALDLKTCPACDSEGHQRRRPGIRAFSSA
jgi:hypothetical protein